MRKAPLIIAAFFIFVTMSRVSHFSSSMGDQKISLFIAICLGVTVFSSSYWTQYRGNSNPSKSEIDKVNSVTSFSWFILVIATAIDGTFNLADVLNTNPVNFFSIIYGIAPTLLALLLGILQAKIDALPLYRSGTAYNIGKAYRNAVKRFLNRIGKEETLPEVTKRKPEHTENKPEPKKILPEFHIIDRKALTEEMKAVLKNGYTDKELKQIFPDVTIRTVRNWKKL